MVKNSEFLETVFGSLDGKNTWIVAFAGDPNAAAPDAWAGQPYLGTTNQRLMIDRRTDQNVYYSVAQLKVIDGRMPRRTKEFFDRLAVLVADDADPSGLNGTPSFIVETSPGKRQIGVLLDADDPNTQDAQLIDAVMQAMADARLIDADKSGNNAVRLCRLPNGINGKGGAKHPVSLSVWNPNARYSLEDALGVFGLDLDAVRSKAVRVTQSVKDTPSDIEHANLVRQIFSGESYHDPLMKLSAKLVASGASGGAVVNHLRGLMEACEDRSERWGARYNEIPRMVTGAERYRPQALPAVTINLSGTKHEASQGPHEPAPMDWGALAGLEPTPAVWRLPGWMPARTTTLLSANGGVGKSNLSLQLAASLALGKPFLGIEAGEPVRVLVLSAEDEARTVHFRLGNICRDLGASLGDLAGRVWAYDMTQTDCVMWGDEGATGRIQWLADHVEQHQADVVIIDNASDVYAANENDRAQVRGFMRALNAIAQHSGAAVLLLAHVDKAAVRMGAGSDTNSTFSGSTAWNNSARSRWAMTRDQERVVTLRHEKCNFGPLQGEIRLEFDPEAKVFRPFGQVPALQAARNVLRNSQRVEVWRIVSTALMMGTKLSLEARANNNVYVGLKMRERLPQVDRRDVFEWLTQWISDGLIAIEDYTIGRTNKTAQRLVLTEEGIEEVKAREA